MDVETKEIAQEVVDDLRGRFLTFYIGEALYGIELLHIADILSVQPITYVPGLPHYFKGVINLRGAVVPIMDFRLLLGQEPGEKSCTIVLDNEGVQIGVMVDEVDQTVDIEKKNILPVPSQSAGGESKLVSGMCSLPNQNGTLMVLDCSLLFHGQLG